MTSIPKDYAPVDPNGVAFGLGTDFCVVTITTREGAVYQMADMSESEFRKVMPESGRVPSSQPAVMMANISGVVMTVPFRIIKDVRVGEEVVWACPA